MRTLAILSALALCGAVAITPTAAEAAVTLWDGTGATDTIDWGQLGTSFTAVPNMSAVQSNGGANATVSGAGNMERRDQGNGWNGNFAAGEKLLWSGASDSSITISFETSVWSVGAQFQGNDFGDYVAHILLNDGSFFDLAGTSDQLGDDSNPFFGVFSDSASISSITFSLLSNADGGFAISQVDLNGTSSGGAVPEPATWAMMLLGFGATGFAIRRARRQLATA